MCDFKSSVHYSSGILMEAGHKKQESSKEKISKKNNKFLLPEYPEMNIKKNILFRICILDDDSIPVHSNEY